MAASLLLGRRGLKEVSAIFLRALNKFQTRRRCKRTSAHLCPDRLCIGQPMLSRRIYFACRDSMY